jgi:hypothetical protein
VSNAGIHGGLKLAFRSHHSTDTNVSVGGNAQAIQATDVARGEWL